MGGEFERKRPQEDGGPRVVGLPSSNLCDQEQDVPDLLDQTPWVLTRAGQRQTQEPQGGRCRCAPCHSFCLECSERAPSQREFSNFP